MSWLEAMVGYGERLARSKVADTAAEAIDERAPTPLPETGGAATATSSCAISLGLSAASSTGVREPAGGSRFSGPVALGAVDKVHAARERALGLGWSEARQYQNHGRYAFPCGQEHGLVCFLRPGDRIGEITPSFIEIVGARGRRLRFYNPDSAQPWLRPAAA